MVWTILALLTMIVLGGFISYYGDLQGRRWGKKRVSWFGMRPKHTAILITSLTGAFISLLSVVTLLLIVPPVRAIILHGEHAIEENKHSIEENKKLAKNFVDQIELSKYAQDKLNKELVTQHRKLDATESNLVYAQNELKPLNAEVVRLNKAKDEAAKTLQQMVVTVDGLKRQEAQLSQENKSLTILKGRLAFQNNELSKQNYRMGQENTRLASINSDLTTQNKTLTTANAVLTKESDTLLRTNKTLLESDKQLDRGNQETQGQLEQARNDLAQVKAELEQAKQIYDANYSSLVGEGRNLASNYVAIRQNKISVRVGSELARQSLDAHMSARAVREQLQQLLQDASVAAQHYGAGLGANGRAVSIVSKQMPTLTGTEQADEGDSLNALVSNLEGHSQPVVVVAHAFSNTLEGEPAPIELKAIDIDPIFASGQVLATGHIDASKSDGEVQQAVAQFLQTDVRAAAIKAGTVPQVDPSTGISEVGKVDPLDLARLVSRARRMGGDLTIRAVAAMPITSADPLDRRHLRLDLLR